MKSRGLVAVVGAGGFVGSAVAKALLERGFEVRAVSARRLPQLQQAAVSGFLQARPPAFSDLVRELEGCHAVINAAGLAQSDSRDVELLTAANGVLPGLLAAASREAGAVRFVHVSSAAVQGRRRVLDDSGMVEPFSAYSRSKALGERLAQEWGDGMVVIYRPPSVHGATRTQTRGVVRIATSPLASVARPGTFPTPQALIENVGDAAAFLATTNAQPPPIVIHPWEGLSTSDLMELLGNRRPVLLPGTAARLLVGGLSLLGRRVPWIAANARRIEVLWFGQGQASSWLTKVGWVPPAGRGSWAELGMDVRASQEN